MNLSKTNPLILAVVLGCFLLAPFSAISQQATGSHLVVYGQTLSKIARMYGMTVAELKSLNNLTSDGIYPNKELRVIDRLNVLPQEVQQVDRGLADVPVYRETPPQFAPANNNNTTMSGSGIRYIDMTTYERQRNFVNRGGVPAATSNLDNLYSPQPVYNQPATTAPAGPVYRTREDVMLDQISRSANTGYDPFSPPYQQQNSFYQSTNNPVSRDVFRSANPANGNMSNDPSVQGALDALKSLDSASPSTSTSINPNYPILKSKYFKVPANYTIYDVAKRFQVSVEQLRLWNDVTEVHQDDVIVVGKYYGDYSPSPGFGYRQNTDNLRLGTGNIGRGGAEYVNDFSSSDYEYRGVEKQSAKTELFLDYPGNISTYDHQPERANARYMEYGSFIAYEAKMPGEESMYALHKYLKPGSKVMVEVPGNDKNVSVTVVGYLSPEEDSIIALSPSAIQALGPHQNTIRIKY